MNKKISSPMAIVLLEYVFLFPIVSVQDFAKHADISYQISQKVILQFVSLGILKEITGKKRDKRFSYWEYLECLSEGTHL
jgi:hypothetical protein